MPKEHLHFIIALLNFQSKLHITSLAHRYYIFITKGDTQMILSKRVKVKQTVVDANRKMKCVTKKNIKYSFSQNRIDT